MKIKIKEQTEREIEIKTPCYIKSEGSTFHYKIVDENRAVQVVESLNSIEPIPTEIAVKSDFEEITEQQFMEVYEKALTNIKELLSVN